jgi:hypothetical protein
MVKGFINDAVLAVQGRTGITASVLISIAIAAFAALTAFAFLCVAAYAWLSLQIGALYAGLVMAAVFIAIAVIGAVVGAIARRRARERAILARAARANAPSWLLDPRVLATAVQIGRQLGWQRVIPLALVGILAAQWAREHRERAQEPAE